MLSTTTYGRVTQPERREKPTLAALSALLRAPLPRDFGEWDYSSWRCAWTLAHVTWPNEVSRYYDVFDATKVFGISAETADDIFLLGCDWAPRERWLGMPIGPRDPDLVQPRHVADRIDWHLARQK